MRSAGTSGATKRQCYRHRLHGQVDEEVSGVRVWRLYQAKKKFPDEDTVE